MKHRGRYVQVTQQIAGLRRDGRSTQPHQPWMVLPSTFGPFVAPPAAGSPYSPGGMNQGADNPPPFPLPSGHPTILTTPISTHANITRFWPEGETRYTIVIPRSVPPVSGNTPDLNTTMKATFPSLVSGTSSAGTSYTWNDWVRAVRGTFDRYTKIATAETNALFQGTAYEPTPYSLTTGAPNFAATVGQFIWPINLGGPTGNGVNEIILCDNTVPGLGLTSMLVDPTTGAIIECDVIFDVGVTAANPGSTGGFFQSFQVGTQNITTTPNEWTGLPHEVGHYFGMDHTNLHPGLAFPAALPVGSYAVGTGASRAVYPTTINPAAPPFPMMVGFVTYLGAGADATTAAMHPDDATCLSLTYPVDMPRPLSSKVPLINNSASIRGRLTDDVVNFAGVFGRNVWVVPQDLLDAAGGFPTTGIISGASRITDDPLVLQAGLYVDNRVSVTAPMPSFIGTSVLGAFVTFNTNATGDFSVDGIPAPSLDISLLGAAADPPEFDLVIEESQFLGVAGLGGNQAEWFGQTGTPITYAAIPGSSAGNPLPIPLTTPLGVAMTSHENISTTGCHPDAAATPVQSTSMLAGTVIYVNGLETLETNIVGAPGIPPTLTGSSCVALSVPPGTTQPPRLREQQVRPLVGITPRTGRAASSTLDITIRLDTPATHTAFAYDMTTATLVVNGVDQSSLISSVGTTTHSNAFVPGTTFVPAPCSTTISIPMTSITGLPGITTNTPIQVDFHIAAVAILDDGTQIIGMDFAEPTILRPIATGVGRNIVVL